MIRSAIDAVVESVVGDGAPLVIAAVTDRRETRYLRAAGVDAADSGTETVIALHSVTKAFTATAALQCVEEGLLDLDAPASRYVGDIGALEVLVELTDDGVSTRPSARDITARMLLQHTSGLAYDMFDERVAAIARRRPASDTPLRDSLLTPLVHEPGERWTYGTSMDWLGLVVEAIRGQRLDDVFRAGIFEPCAMGSTSFDLTPSMRARLAPMHRRGRDGAITKITTIPPDSPEIDMGGQGLYSTVPDVLRFLRVWLGDGVGPRGRVLQPETIAQAARGVPGLAVVPLAAAIPALTRVVEFFPGIEKSWAHSFLVNDDHVPGGRRAGSLSWGGLANVHYWIDRDAGIAAVWAMQLLPFFDPLAAVGLTAFEQAVYAEA